MEQSERKWKKALEDSEVYLVFLDKACLTDNRVRKNFEYAISINKPMLKVYVDDLPYDKLFSYESDNVFSIYRNSETNLAFEVFKSFFIMKSKGYIKQIPKLDLSFNGATNRYETFEQLKKSMTGKNNHEKRK